MTSQQSLPNGDYRFHSQSQDLGTLQAIYNFSVDIRNRSQFVVTSWSCGQDFDMSLGLEPAMPWSIDLHR